MNDKNWIKDGIERTPTVGKEKFQYVFFLDQPDGSVEAVSTTGSSMRILPLSDRGTYESDTFAVDMDKKPVTVKEYEKRHGKSPTLQRVIDLTMPTEELDMLMWFPDKFKNVEHFLTGDTINPEIMARAGVDESWRCFATKAEFEGATTPVVFIKGDRKFILMGLKIPE